jgi:hypothetical protein
MSTHPLKSVGLVQSKYFSCSRLVSQWEGCSMRDIFIIALYPALCFTCFRTSHVNVVPKSPSRLSRAVRAFLLSLSQPHHFYQNLLSQGVGMGIGMGLMFLPAASVPAHYFRARRSFAMGLVISGMFDTSQSRKNLIVPGGSSIGAVVYPILLNHLLYGPAGFGWGVR